MGKARAVHAELSLSLQQEEEEQQQKQPATRPASASSTASGASASAGALLQVGTGKVWGALKAEYPEGPPALPEYWQVALLVAHLEREAAAVVVALGGGEEGEAVAEAEG